MSGLPNKVKRPEKLFKRKIFKITHVFIQDAINLFIIKVKLKTN